MSKANNTNGAPVASLLQLGVGGAVSSLMGSRSDAPENFAFFTNCGSHKSESGKVLLLNNFLTVAYAKVTMFYDKHSLVVLKRL